MTKISFELTIHLPTEGLDEAVFHLAISNMAQRHIAFCERHVALHVRHVALHVHHVALPIFRQ